MTYFGNNLKRVRKYKKLSQSAFADLFGITRASVGSYEEGRAEPKNDKLIEIANYFSITVDDFLTKDLTINQISGFSKIEQKSAMLQGKGSMSIAKSLPSSFKSVKYVGITDAEEFAAKLNDNVYVKALPEIVFPLDVSGNLMAFQHKGNGLIGNGVYYGDVLFCKEVVDISSWVTSDKLCVVLIGGRVITVLLTVTESGIFYKEDSMSGMNNINPSELIKIWEVVGVFSTTFQKVVDTDSRVKDLEKKMDVFNKYMDRIK